MLDSSRDAILARLDAGDVVLDVGGGAHPFERADWVIDLLPYGNRGLYGEPGPPGRERFSEQTWVVQDICAHDAWPFADKQFDFVVCSHTLEDVRDPVRVCQELVRVARAGYIEVPSRLEEQSYGWQGPWAGWSHHRWLVDVESGGLSFVFKSAVLHGRPRNQFPADFRWALPPERRVQSLWWEGGFRYEERILAGAAELDGYLSSYVEANRPPRPPLAERILARLRWLRDRPAHLFQRSA